MFSLLRHVFDAQFFAAATRMTAPILLAALGGVLCRQSGVLNVALEGMMLIGAFGAVAGSFYTGNWLVGVAAAMASAVVCSVLLGVTILRFRANQLVVGVAFNMFAGGATTFLMRSLWQVKGSFIDPRIVPLPKWELPVLDGVPVLGPILSGHTPVVYASWLILILVNYLVYHTPFGLRLRATGENEDAARTLGVKVPFYRYVAMVSSGALCGLAGAQLSLGLVTLFLINMTAGRGFVSLASVILGQGIILGAAGASLLFGIGEGLTMRLQGLRMPTQFVLMLPYVLTIIVMVLLRPRKPRVKLPPGAIQIQVSGQRPASSSHTSG